MGAPNVCINAAGSESDKIFLRYWLKEENTGQRDGERDRDLALID
jgi:hypothetical protein